MKTLYQLPRGVKRTLNSRNSRENVANKTSIETQKDEMSVKRRDRESHRNRRIA